MNPSTPVALATGGLMHDVRPPTPKVMPPTAPIKAEMVESIPVKNPDAATQPNVQMAATNPVATGLQSSINSAQPKNDQELDKILQDVNRGVKASEAHERLQAAQKLSVVKLLPIAAAVLIAGALVMAAVLAFRPSTGHIRTRATSQAGL